MENPVFLGLTEEQKDKFDRDGILVIENFLDQNEVETLRNACHSLVESMDPEVHRGVFSAEAKDTQAHANDRYFLDSNDKIRFFFETDAFDENGKLQLSKHACLNKMGHALHWVDPDFKKISFSNKVKSVARGLDFQDPVVVQGMYIFKQPKVGGEVCSHQDGTFLRNDPLKLMGYWFPIDDATLTNGCLWYVPGSHKICSPVKRHFIRNPMYFEQQIKENLGEVEEEKEQMLVFEGEPYMEFPEEKWVAAPVNKGSLVLIHGQVMHRSARNCSTKPRHAYTFHIVETVGSKYRKTNWLQPTVKMPFPKLYEN